ncbi:MAG: histidine phosphatase family protein [Paracoccaceae bacterium]
MTGFWWVRHGPTHAREFAGWRDLPADLSDTAAIARLDAALPRPALLVSSDLVRASATADALAAGRQRLPHDPALREFDFGEWDGLAFDAVAARDPDLSRSFWENPGDAAPPNGESWNSVAARVHGAMHRLADSGDGGDIIAVAHVGVIMTALQLAGLTATEALSHRIDTLLTRMHRDGGHW